jgi:hypothetical protein
MSVHVSEQILSQAEALMQEREAGGMRYPSDPALRASILRCIAFELLQCNTGEAPEAENDREHAIVRDRLTVQWLMGGKSTIYDNASLHHPGLIETQVIKWLTGDFHLLRHRAGLLLGSCGSGKTWGMVAYGISRMRVDFSMSGAVKNCSGQFITAYRLSEMLHNQRKFQDQLDELLRKQVLLVDDLGTEPRGYKGEDFQAHFGHLFSERHKSGKITLITSNATVTDTEIKDSAGNVLEVVPGIRTLYGQRFVSRFNEFGAFFESTDPDFRENKEQK